MGGGISLKMSLAALSDLPLAPQDPSLVRVGGPCGRPMGLWGWPGGRVGASAALDGLNRAIPSASPWLCTWPCTTYFPSLGLCFLMW